MLFFYINLGPGGGGGGRWWIGPMIGIAISVASGILQDLFAQRVRFLEGSM